MKKIIVLIALLMLTLASMSSCFIPGPPSEEETEGYTRIVRNDMDISITEIRDGAYRLSGRMLSVFDDSEPASSGEIVLGISDRAVSRAAREALEELYTDTEDCGYVIYAADGSVAVYWSDSLLMDVALDRFVALCIIAGKIGIAVFVSLILSWLKVEYFCDFLLCQVFILP